MVTRTSDVRPELLAGSFLCLKCGLEAPEVPQQMRYTTPTICRNPQCNNASKNKWQLQMDRSKFADWQRIRVQEATDEIPAGSLPQSLDVIVRDEMVDDALRQLKSAGGALDGVEDIVTPRDAKDALTAKKMRQRPRLYEALAESIAPTVFEHKDIKHDMLLQLVGGVAKQTHEGIKLRGTINVRTEHATTAAAVQR